MDYFSRDAIRRATGVQRVKLTKALAERFLTWNLSSNRNLNIGYSNNLKDKMDNEAFDFDNGDIFCRFDVQGSLIDGQHRLTAFVNSTLTEQHVTIAFGLSVDAFKTIDDGRKRTPGDVLTIQGFNNPIALASVVRLSIRFLNGGNTKSDTNSRLSNADILTFTEEHEAALIRATTFAINNVQNSDKLLAISVVGSFHFLTYSNYGNRVETFFNGLATGLDLSSDSPIYQLRKLLIQHQRSTKTTLTTKSKHLYVAKALYLYLHNFERKNLNIQVTDTVLKYFPHLNTNNGEE